MAKRIEKIDDKEFLDEVLGAIITLFERDSDDLISIFNTGYQNLLPIEAIKKVLLEEFDIEAEEEEIKDLLDHYFANLRIQLAVEGDWLVLKVADLPAGQAGFAEHLSAPQPSTKIDED